MSGAKTTRFASLQIAVFVSLGLAILIQQTGASSSAVVFGATGLLLGIIIVLRAQQTDITRSIASVFIPIIGIFLLTGVGLLAFEMMRVATQHQLGTQTIVQLIIRDVGINIAAAVATFGTAGTIAKGIGDRGVTRLASTAIGNLFTVGVFLLAYIYFRSALLTSVNIPTIDVSQILSYVLQPRNTGEALLSFWLLVIFSLFLARSALSAIPLVELASRRYEEQLEQGQDLLRWWLGFAAVLLTLVAAVFLFVFAPGTDLNFAEQLRKTLGYGVSQRILVTIGAEGLRYTLLAASLVFATTTFAFKALEYLTGSITNTIRRLSPSVVGGLVAITVPLLALPRFPVIVSMIPPPQRQLADQLIDAVGPYGVLVAGMGAAIAVVTLVLILLAGAGMVRFIPVRGGSGALAAAGIAIGAIALALVESAPFPVLTLVALSILIWSAGKRGVTTRTELGASPPLTLETLHLLGGVLIVVPTAAFTWWIYTDPLASIPTPAGTVVSVVALLVALNLFIASIRG